MYILESQVLTDQHTGKTGAQRANLNDTWELCYQKGELEPSPWVAHPVPLTNLHDTTPPPPVPML